jgi:hypothetical protein
MYITLRPTLQTHKHQPLGEGSKQAKMDKAIGLTKRVTKDMRMHKANKLSCYS